jgi:hypothetical protein
MRPCGTKLLLQFGQAVHARKAYTNHPLIDTFIYLQCLSLFSSDKLGPLNSLQKNSRRSRSSGSSAACPGTLMASALE